MAIFTNGYDNYARDAEMIIESDMCYINGLDVEWTEDGPTRPNSNKSNHRQQFLTYSQGKNGKKGASKGISAVPRHRLNPTDRVNPGDSLLQILLGILSNFFAHSPELNLIFTGVLSALAICPYRSLEGWLVFSGTDRLDKRDSHIRDYESLNPQEARNVELSFGIVSNDVTVADGEDKSINDFDEDDDRSIDYNADKSPSATKAIGATPMWTSYPPFFTIFKTLTQQVDYYRSEIDGFDQYLEDRRNGLLDADDEIDENFFKQQQPLLHTRPLTRKSSNSNFSSSPNLVPSKNRKNTSSSPSSAHRTPKRANSLSRSESNSTPLLFKSSSMTSSNITTPLSTHFEKTEGIKIQPLFPTHFVNEDEEEDQFDPLEDDDEVISAKQSTRTKQKETKPKEISLSTLLNNVVILEEAIKELVSIVQVRRSLGIDEVRYL